VRTLRRALASADYRGTLDLDAIDRAMRPGANGAAKLRKALAQHQPALARTKSRLERLLLELCEQHDIPLPEVNVRVSGWQVDALWRDAGLAVELDGYGNHHTPAQLRRDRRKEMALRQAGLTPLRYSEDQLERHSLEVVGELRSLAAPGVSPA
jgi:very-short-patch-repair endonuclease